MSNKNAQETDMVWKSAWEKKHMKIPRTQRLFTHTYTHTHTHSSITKNIGPSYALE